MIYTIFIKKNILSFLKIETYTQKNKANLTLITLTPNTVDCSNLTYIAIEAHKRSASSASLTSHNM